MAGFKSKIGDVYYESIIFAGIGGGSHPVIVCYHKIDNEKREWIAEDISQWYNLDQMTTNPMQQQDE